MQFIHIYLKLFLLPFIWGHHLFKNYFLSHRWRKCSVAVSIGTGIPMICLLISAFCDSLYLLQKMLTWKGITITLIREVYGCDLCLSKKLNWSRKTEVINSFLRSMISVAPGSQSGFQDQTWFPSCWVILSPVRQLVVTLTMWMPLAAILCIGCSAGTCNGSWILWLDKTV